MSKTSRSIAAFAFIRQIPQQPYSSVHFPLKSHDHTRLGLTNRSIRRSFCVCSQIVTATSSFLHVDETWIISNRLPAILKTFVSIAFLPNSKHNLMRTRSSLILNPSTTANETNWIDVYMCNIKLKWVSDFGFCLKCSLIRGEYIYL